MLQSETSELKANTEQTFDDVFKVPAPKPLKTLNQVRKIDENSTVDFKLPELLSQSLPPEGKYFIEILKNGSIIERCNITNSRYTFGRSRDCDFPLDHPSISRYHACLLWSNDNNFYLKDLDSVHGTFLNKEKLNSQCLTKLSPGNNIIKFGGSSRIFMLGTTETSQDEQNFFEETDYRNSSPQCREEEEEGCDWGMRDLYYHDYEGESGEIIDTLAQVLSILERGSNEPSKNENAYRANPQKTMQQWFEREGYDFEYQIDHHNGHFKCTFTIPIEDQDVPISGNTSVKKKEAIENACLKCCQVLDRAGILFPWQRQKPNKPQEGSSESEDEMIDETEQYKKKKARKEAIKSGKLKTQDIENFETLNEKWKELSSELQRLKAELVFVKLNEKNKANEKIDESEDALDAFMEDMNANNGIHSSLHTKIQKSQLKMSIIEIEKKQRKLEKMIKIAKPSFTFPKLSSDELESKPVYKPILKRQIKSEKFSNDPEKPKVSRLETTKPEKSEATNSETKAKFKMSLTKKSLQPSAAARILEDQETKVAKQDIRRLLPSEDKEFGLILKKDKASNQEKQFKLNYMESEAYVEWVPPSGQTGDGRTSLNDKLGY